MEPRLAFQLIILSHVIDESVDTSEYLLSTHTCHRRLRVLPTRLALVERGLRNTCKNETRAETNSLRPGDR